MGEACPASSVLAVSALPTGYHWLHVCTNVLRNESHGMIQSHRANCVHELKVGTFHQREVFDSHNLLCNLFATNGTEIYCLTSPAILYSTFYSTFTLPKKYVITFYQALCGGNSLSLVATIFIPVVQLSSQKHLDFSSGAIGKFHVGTWLECFHKLVGRLKIWFARCDWNATTIIILGHFCLTILSCS